ncbi:hypothetical protein ACRE1U_08665 [Helicobacter himalayensis]|uniref:hypothetical protein n=1 Tax=Helicobacter himalayensis TaxID=1591088 RepID=UPI003D6E7E60
MKGQGNAMGSAKGSKSTTKKASTTNKGSYPPPPIAKQPTHKQLDSLLKNINSNN